MLIVTMASFCVLAFQRNSGSCSTFNHWSQVVMASESGGKNVFEIRFTKLVFVWHVRPSSAVLLVLFYVEVSFALSPFGMVSFMNSVLVFVLVLSFGRLRLVVFLYYIFADAQGAVWRWLLVHGVLALFVYGRHLRCWVAQAWPPLD